MKTKKAFSFIELIIVIALIALLAVVGMSYQGASNQKAKNTRIKADIGTINNSLANYFEEKKTLPMPKGNKNFFKKDSSYGHYDDNDNYGVHGFVTQDLLPKKYLNYLPLDPRTNQYYAYGKTLDNKFYEVAGVVNIEGKYKTSLKGNYPADNGPYSLIREYDGPNFIENNSQTSFPYNPTERVLVGKINKFSGNVTIISNGNTISGNNILTHTLVKGDKIEVPQHGSATIFFSDGSQSVLGDSTKKSTLVLTDMSFKKENNLLTRIKLTLDEGTLWTKATNLNSEDGGSDFEVNTQDTTAAVRGTIFLVNYKNNKTTVIVVKGKIKTYPESDNYIPNTTKAKQVINAGEESTNFSTPTTTTTTVPEFPLDLTIPNNTKTGAVLENKKDILEKVKEEEKRKLEEAEEQANEREYGELYAKADFDTPGDLSLKSKDNITTSSGDLLRECGCRKGKDENKYDYPKCVFAYGQCSLTTNKSGWQNIFNFVNPVSEDIKKNDLTSFSSGSESVNIGIDNSWFKYTKNGKTVKGIYIEKNKECLPLGCYYIDFLKYSGLNLGDKFAIEMSVKGLDRSDDNHTLFKIGSQKLFLDSGKIKFGDNNTIEFDNNKATDGFDKIAVLFSKTTDNNNKYNVTIKLNGEEMESGTIELSDDDKKNIIVGANETILGHTTYYSQQWNNIIDYIKIYTK